MVKFFLVTSFFLFGLYGLAEAAGTPCDKNQTLACLKAHSKAVYRDNFPLFFAIMKSSRDQAAACKGPITAQFIDLAPSLQGNTDATKYYFSNLEKVFILGHTECFLKAYKAQTAITKKVILQELRAPHYITLAQMKDAFRKPALNSEFKTTVAEILTLK